MASWTKYKWDEKQNKYVVVSSPDKNNGAASSSSASKKTSSNSSAASSRVTAPRGETARNGMTSGASRSGTTAYNAKNTAESTLNTLDKSWQEWQEFLRGIRAGAARNDLAKDNDVAENAQKLNDQMYKPGAKNSLDFLKFQTGKTATKTNTYRENLKAGIDTLGVSDKEASRLIADADKKASSANHIYALARARSGDASVLEDAKGTAREEYARLLRLSGYDTMNELASQQLPANMQRNATLPIDIPVDYNNNTFGDDIYRYKFGEDLDGTKLTEDQRQAAKKRVETVSGVQDLDTVKNLTELTYDPEYLDDLQKLNSGAQTYQDVLDRTSQYDNKDIAADMLVMQDYHEGHVKRSPDEVQRAANRIKAATGVDVLNARDLEAAFDQAVQTNEGLREAVAQAVYKETGQMPDGAEFDLDDYMAYMEAYMQVQNNAMREEGEQLKFDNTVQQKYGQYQTAPNFASMSQPISLDITPTNEAEAIHEAIVAIDEPKATSKFVIDSRNDELFAQLADSGMPTAAQQKYTADTITPEQRAMFHYLWNSGRQDESMQYLEDIDWSVRKAIAQKTEDINAQLSEGPVGGFASSLASVLAGPGRAAVAPVNAARTALGQEIDQYDPTFNVGRASDTIRSNVGQNLDELLNGANIAGWKIGSGAYQGAMSVADSMMLSSLGAKYGAPVMGLEAADTAMRTALDNGRTQGEALRDAYVTAGIESLTERLPMENLFGDVGKPGRYIISNTLSEMGEEVASEGLNMIYDTLAYGKDSDLGRLRSELIARGYAGAGLTLGMLKEIAGRFRDAAFGGAAGGFVGATPRGAATAIADRTAGRNLQSNGASKQMLELAAQMLPEGESKDLAREQLDALDGKARPKYSKKPNKKGDYTVIGEEVPKVSNAKLGRVYREMLGAVDEHVRGVLEDTMVRNVREMLRTRGVNDSALAGAVARVAAGDGSATTEDYSAVAVNDAALEVAQELTGVVSYARGVQQEARGVASYVETADLHDKLPSAKLPSVEEGSDEHIGRAYDDGEHDAEAKGEELLTPDSAEDADTARQLVQESAAEYGANADLVAAAYEDGQDPTEFAQQFHRAFEYGEEGRNYDVIKNSGSFSGLTESQISIAYEMGRGERIFRAKQAVTNRRGMVAVGNIDTGEIRGMRLNDAQSKSVGAISSLAKAVGFNVKFIANTADAEGRITGKNGSWDKATRTITIDINAGRVSTSDANYAMMQTAGHELTHFIKDFADTALWDDYQSFVFGHLSEAMDEGTLDAKVEQYIERWAQAGKTIDRDGAIEEIVADASGDVLLKLTDADIQQIAKSNPSLLKKIGQFVQRWVKNVRAMIEKAYKGQTARNPIAEQMLDVADELGARWAELLKNASQSARQSEAGAGETAPKSAYDGAIDFVDYAFVADEKYSVREVNGRNVVWIDNDITKDKPKDQKYTEFIAEYLTEHIGEVYTIIESGQKVYLGEDLPNEYTGSKYTKRIRNKGQEAFRAKNKAAASLGEAIEIASNRRWEKTRHPHNKDAKYGIYRYSTRIAFPIADSSGKTIKVNAYSADLLIRNASDGRKYLYDVVGIKNDAITADSLLKRETARQGETPAKLKGIISDNRIAQNDDDVKFSLRSPVERTKDLVAVHNIREDNLRKALDLGGFPMPSIAIAKRDIGHQNFGAISLVFGSDTIDPKANKRNKVYSADAWTPTFPQVEYEVDAKADTRIYNKLTGLKRKVDPYFEQDLNRMLYGIEDQLNRNGGEEGLVQRALDNYGMKAAYLEDIGEHAEVAKTMVSEERKYTEKQIEIYKQIADLVGLDNLRNMPMSEIYSQYGDAINDIYPGASNSKMRFQRVLVNVSEYFRSKDSAPAQKEVTDPAATHAAIDAKINPNAYERWVRDMYSGIVRGSGVYNGKELFTPSGNRRSFAATHYPATVEGIAKAMYDAHGGKVKNISANHDAKSLRAVTAKSFKSIDEMHDNVGRLKTRTQEEADALTSSLDKRLADLASIVLDTKPRSRDAYESLMDHDQVVAILQEVAEKKYSAATIKSAYAGYGYDIDNDTAKKLKMLLDDISVMPVNIFEAKPERAVYFDEVKYAIVPDTMDSDLRRRLEELVPDVREYADGDEAQRLELLNAREDLLFQLRDPDQVSDRELLANVMDSAAENAAELDFVRRYRAKIEELNEKQTELERLNQDIVNARREGVRKSDIAVMQNRAKILGGQIDRMDGQLLKFEAGKPLQAVVKRQREELRRRTLERVERSAGRRKYLERLQREAAQMRQWLTAPTNKEHVPEFMRKTLGEFLESIDLYSRTVNSANKKLANKNPTKADNKLLEDMKKLREVLENVHAGQNGLDDAAANFASDMGYLDLPPDFMNEFRKILQTIEEQITDAHAITSEQRAAVRMSVEQLKQLSRIVTTLNSSVRKMNRFIANAKYASAIEASRDTVKDLEKFKDQKDRSKLIKKLGDFMNWKNTVPYYAFKRFGKGGQAIFESLMDGWDKLAFLADQTVKFTEDTYDAKEVNAWERDVKKVQLSNGETVRMTTAQLMSLYCLCKREQAVGHLMGGGIRIADIEGKRGKSIAQSENYMLSEADIGIFRSQLTDRQIAVADALQRDMVERGGALGNEISMKRFGYEMFGEANYFPIESDRNNMRAKDPNAQENSLLRLLNMSATKELTKGANNAIVVRSIFDVYTAHMADMAKYNALGLQILDMMKWLNYVEKLDSKGNPLDPDKLKRGEYDGEAFQTRSVQKSLELAYGTEARNYIMEFIKNLNGETEGGREDGFIKKQTSNYKIAAVGANLRVGLLQITSMPRAAMAINPVYLLDGVRKWTTRMGNTSRQVTDKVGIAKWKSMGFYDTNISRDMREMIKHDTKAVDKIRERSMKLAEWGDAWTMGVLYGAVESELQKKEPKLKPGSEAWDKRMNDRVREIIYQTQVVDSTMTRSHLMRQKGFISGALSFMSEPTLALNIVNNALFEDRMNRRAGKKWYPGTKKKIAKAFAIGIATSALSAFVEALFSAIRDDDEFETFSEKYFDALIGDYSEAEVWQDYGSAFLGSALGSKVNPLGDVPIVGDMLAAFVSGAATQMWQEFAEQLGGGFRALWKAIREDGSLADYYGASYKIVDGFSKFGGVPVSGAMREVVSMYNTFAAEPMGWRRLQTYANNKNDAAKAYYAAIGRGDSERAAHILERARINGIPEEDIGGTLVSYIKDDFISGNITEAAARNRLEQYTDKDADKIDEYIKEWSYHSQTGYKYDDMKADYISGAISRSDMQTLLAQYRGYDSDEVFWQLSEWDYAKAHDGESGGKMSWFLDAVEAGSGYEQYADELLAHGVDKGDIASRITSTFKEEYRRLYGTAAGDALREHLLDVYEYIGYDRDYEWSRYMSKWMND